MKTDINDVQLIEWLHLFTILSEHSEMLVTVVSSTKQLMITNFTWTQTPVGYLRQREITLHVSYQLSDIIAKMQWCSVTLSLDLISRVDLCNIISLNSPYLRVFSPCSFKSEVTDCIMRKTAKRSQLLEVTNSENIEEIGKCFTKHLHWTWIVVLIMC